MHPNIYDSCLLQDTRFLSIIRGPAVGTPQEEISPVSYYPPIHH